MEVFRVLFTFGGVNFAVSLFMVKDDMNIVSYVLTCNYSHVELYRNSYFVIHTQTVGASVCLKRAGLNPRPSLRDRSVAPPRVRTRPR